MSERRKLSEQAIVVNVPAIKEPIQPSPGFAKKGLADYKLDAMGLCQYGCLYCSSNDGNYLRINREQFADMTEEQIGERIYPSEEPALTFQWPDFLERLDGQLSKKTSTWGEGKTLVYSMLTDGFSPMVVRSGVTEKALRQVLERTSFRIRVLTKNAVVGQKQWVGFFQQYPDRFVIGMSTGTLDDNWARKVETFTATPTGRLHALRGLQDAGIPTYGMLCPIFPDMLEGDRLEQLIDLVRPQRVEHLWAEPYNDRKNWEHVRAGYDDGSFGYRWMSDVYGERKKDRWSHYATELYLRLRDKAVREGWINKLRYLLYESDITEQDAKRFEGLDGVWLQSKPADGGKSRNQNLAQYQPTLV